MYSSDLGLRGADAVFVDWLRTVWPASQGWTFVLDGPVLVPFVGVHVVGDWPPQWRLSSDHRPSAVVIQSLHAIPALLCFPAYRQFDFALGRPDECLVVLVNPDEQLDTLALLARACGVPS